MEFLGIAALGGVVVNVCSKLILAVLVYIIGKMIIGSLVGMLEKNNAVGKMEPTARTFLISAVRMGLVVMLIISIISILGVPMASVITVLASAGVAVALALQGALSNLAGGIMILFFKPFSVGDYVDAAGVSGTVKEVTLFYTTIMTLDNRRITVPNGGLMNANVVNYSTEPVRRVDLTFASSKAEAPEKIQEIIQGVIAQDARVLKDPAAPFARLSGGSNEAMEFTVRVWVNSADYWDVYFDLTQKVTEAFAANGVQAPAVRVVQ